MLFKIEWVNRKMFSISKPAKKYTSLQVFISTSVFKLDPTNVNIKSIVLAVGLKWITPRLDQLTPLKTG